MKPARLYWRFGYDVLKSFQVCAIRVCGRSEGASSNVVGIICPLAMVEIWLTDLPKPGGRTAPLVPSSLAMVNCLADLNPLDYWYFLLLSLRKKKLRIFFASGLYSKYQPAISTSIKNQEKLYLFTVHDPVVSNYQSFVVCLALWSSQDLEHYC